MRQTQTAKSRDNEISGPAWRWNTRRDLSHQPEQTGQSPMSETRAGAREGSRGYYQANGEAIRERERQRYAANPEPPRERARQYREANLESVREKQRQYGHAHPDGRRERSRRWKAANQDAVKESSRRYRASLRVAVFDHYGRAVAGCERPKRPTRYPLHRDGRDQRRAS